jgi:hypothetical protein
LPWSTWAMMAMLRIARLALDMGTRVRESIRETGNYSMLRRMICRKSLEFQRLAARTAM